MRSLLSIAVLFLLSTFSIAQIAATPVNEWVKKLSDPKDKKNQASRLLWDSVINSRDSSRIHKLLQQLQANANSNSTYFQIRLNLFKALVLNYRDILRTAKSKTAVMKLMKQAMQEANETNDEYLIAYTSSVYSYICGSYNEPDLSVMYAMLSAELRSCSLWNTSSRKVNSA